MMDKKSVAQVLDEIGTLLELKGENPFRSRAYHNAARSIEAATKDLEELIESGELEEVDGIGERMAKKITEYVTTGRLKYYDEIKASLPPGLPDLLRIQGLGPKRIKALYEKLGIESLADLKEAAETQRLRELPGFGERTELNILKGIEALKTLSEKHLYPKAKEAADRVVGAIGRMKEVKRIETAGSLRRRKETIGDIDIVVSAPGRHREKIAEKLVSHPEVARVIAKGETKTSVELKGGISCDMRVVEDSEYPFALNYFTGSKEHNVEMRSLARKMGWSLNEYAFTTIEGMRARKPPLCKDESDIYEALGLQYIPPELRENMGEFEAARGDRLPKLVELSDLRGTFHCHTTYSDGNNTIEEMARAAQKLGWEYLGIADHSKTAVYAGGLSPEQVREQHKEIDRLNAKFKKFRIFKGTEADILADGSLDYPDDLLASFDYVIASIHSRLNMSESEATSRVIKALTNNYVTVLGHPTGRVLLSRDGYPVNMVEVIDAAADHGKAIEINSHPTRLDLDWRLVKYAKEKLVPVFINPDAHLADGLKDVQFGVGIARKGWLEAKDVLNTRGIKKVERYFQETRRGA